MVKIFEGCPDLTSLDVKGCRNVTNVSKNMLTSKGIEVLSNIMDGTRGCAPGLPPPPWFGARVAPSPVNRIGKAPT